MNKIDKLNEIIRLRKINLPKDSYTTQLFEKGENTIIKKLGEEFSELIMASTRKDKENFVYESVDFLYHYLVLLNYLYVDLEEIYEEIDKRFKQ